MIDSLCFFMKISNGYNKYRLRIMIKYKNKELMYELLKELKDMMLNYKKVEMHVDTTPYQDN